MRQALAAPVYNYPNKRSRILNLRQPARQVVRLVYREGFLAFLLLLLLILSLWNPSEVRHYGAYVHWKTLGTLLGLLAVTTALQQSGYFPVLARRMLQRLRTERGLALGLVLLTAGLSTFLTNDISLFVVVPLTLSFEGAGDFHLLGRLVVFEAIAANVGSTLTPIGNPQNLFLWHHGSLSFGAFCLAMAPLVLLLTAVLLGFVWWAFPGERLSPHALQAPEAAPDRPLFLGSALLLIGFVLLVDRGFPMVADLLVLGIYLIWRPQVLCRMDWALLVLFAVIFVDFHLLATLPGFSAWVHGWGWGDPGRVYGYTALLSQVWSNVPTAVFATKFTSHWLPIAYGVNVGGNGLVWASLANLIALRLARRRGLVGLFHRWAVPYFGITLALGYLLLAGVG